VLCHLRMARHVLDECHDVISQRFSAFLSFVL
jgi:hypothetical protein